MQEKLLRCEVVGSYGWKQECLWVNGRSNADKRLLPPTSTARARMKQWSLVPGGAYLLESMVELRTGCSVHQLLSVREKMVDETLLDWGLKPLTLTLTFNSWWIWIHSFCIRVYTITQKTLWLMKINLVQMSLACYVDTWFTVTLL